MCYIFWDIMWDDKDFQTSRFCWALFCEFFLGHFWDRIFGNGRTIGATYAYCPYDSSSQNWMIGSGGHGFDGKKEKNMVSCCFPSKSYPLIIICVG